MTRTTLVTGIVLTLMGAGFYLGLMAVAADKVSFTAAIPAIPGILLMILAGLAAARPSWRKHVMHVVMLLGLLLVLGGLGMGLPKLGAVFAGTAERPLAVIEQLLMAVVCLPMMVVGIKSFIDARRARASASSSAE